MQLADKVAIVTGSGYGIGRAIALALVREGSDVVLAARTESTLQKTAREIKSLGRQSLVVKTDLLKPEMPVAMIDNALDKFGKVDILVNNSGDEGPISNVAEMDLQRWNDLLAINLTGTMICCRQVLDKSMIPRKSGVIINITSAAGRRGIPTRSAYSSSKFALRGMTDCWRDELRRHNVRVMLVNPSEVLTDFAEKVGRTQQYSEKKLRSQEIADAIIGALKVDNRGFVPEFSVFATNPF